MPKRVVVTGLGVVSSIGIGTKAFWQNLIGGECGIKRIAQFDASALACQIAGEVPAYKIGDYVPKSYRKATKVMARDIELAVIAADDAFKDAGIKSRAYAEKSDFESRRFGCNIGANLISVELNELTTALSAARDGNNVDLRKWGNEGMNQLTPLWLLKYLPNMLACHVTIIHGLMGPSNTITCAEASSHLAIGEAFRTIQRGKADLAICGGAESRVNPMGMIRQQLLKRLNESHNETPQDALRPFDKDAAGTVYGEGGGLLILEEHEHARKRGAKIYAELAGFAASQDTHSVTKSDPSGHSYGKAIENALKDATLGARDVTVLVPNGIGIAASDRAELNGMRKALGDELKRIAVAPIKAQTGNIGAGGGADAAAAILAIHTGKIPPALNTRSIVDNVPMSVKSEPREMRVDVAVTSVYSLGGQNAALVFRRVS